jgi:transposase-like protein
MNVHKNARMTPHGRALLVRRVREEGWRVVDAAGAAGVSARTANKWLARHRAGGRADASRQELGPRPPQARDPARADQ